MSEDYEKIKTEIEEKFVSLVKEVYGSDLLSVMLYGSAARGAYRKNVSDINILIILEKSVPENIFRLGKSAMRLFSRLRITPLIMTREEFVSAADVFPMEYHDIRNAHRVLYGSNETGELLLTMTNLRHQLEERLRGAVNDIRHLLIAAAGKERTLGLYLKSWSGAQNALFRGLLRLKNIEDLPTDPEQLLERTAGEYGISTAAFTELNTLQRGGKISALKVTEGLLGSLKALAAAVDSIRE